MAEEPKAPAKGGSFLSKKVKGVPMPVIVVGGVVIAYFLYSKYKASQSTTAAATTAAGNVAPGDVGAQGATGATGATGAKGATGKTGAAAPRKIGSGWNTPSSGYNLASAQTAKDKINGKRIALYFQAAPGKFTRFTGQQKAGTPLYTKKGEKL